MQFDKITGFLLFGIKNDTKEIVDILKNNTDDLIKSNDKLNKQVIQVLNKGNEVKSLPQVAKTSYSKEIGTKPLQKEAIVTTDLTDSTLDKLAKRNQSIAKKTKPKEAEYKKDKTGRYRDEKGKFLSAKDLDRLGLKNDEKPKTAKEQVEGTKKAEANDGTKLDIDTSGLLNVADTMGEAYSESFKEIYGLFSGLGGLIKAPMNLYKKFFGKKDKEPQVEAIDTAKDDIVKALDDKKAPSKTKATPKAKTPSKAKAIVKKPVSEQKQRVLDNIKKSKEARKSSNFRKGIKPVKKPTSKVSDKTKVPVKKTVKPIKEIDTSKCECDDTKKVVTPKKQIKEEVKKPVSAKATPTETTPVSKGEKSRVKRANKKRARADKKRNKLLASGNRSSGLLSMALRFLGKPLAMLLPALSGLCSTLMGLPTMLLSGAKSLLGLGGSDKKVDTKKQTKQAIKDVKKSTPKAKPKPKAKTSALSKMFKGAKGIGKVVKGAGIVSAVMGAIDLADIWTDKETKTKGKDGKLDKTAETVGGMGGAMGGAMLGASIGSVVPVVGTAIGGLIGGALGYFGGSFLGDKAGDVLFEEKKAKEVKKGDKKSLADDIKKETSKGTKKEGKKSKAEDEDFYIAQELSQLDKEYKPKSKSHKIDYEGQKVTVSDEQMSMLKDLQKQGKSQQVLEFMDSLAKEQKKPKVAKTKSAITKTPVAKAVSPMSKLPVPQDQKAKDTDIKKDDKTLKEKSSTPTKTNVAPVVIKSDNSDVVNAIKNLGTKLDKSIVENKATTKNIISHTPRRDSIMENM